MNVLFPDGLDLQHLTPGRKDKNEFDRSHSLSYDDLLYMIAELQKKIGANHSEDSSSLDYRVNNIRCGEADVEEGINTIEFEEVANERYLVWAYLLNNEGAYEIVVPILSPNPLGDSRRKTAFNVDCASSGRLYWKIEPSVG